MEIKSLLENLFDDPKNLRLFAQTLDSVIKEGEESDLKEFLDAYFSGNKENPGVEQLLISAGHKARTCKDEPRRDIIYFFIGNFFMEHLGNREKGELYFRNVSVNDENRDFFAARSTASMYLL